jgi:hypothetical protein
VRLYLEKETQKKAGGVGGSRSSNPSTEKKKYVFI